MRDAQEKRLLRAYRRLMRDVFKGDLTRVDLQEKHEEFVHLFILMVIREYQSSFEFHVKDLNSKEFQVSPDIFNPVYTASVSRIRSRLQNYYDVVFNTTLADILDAAKVVSEDQRSDFIRNMAGLSRKAVQDIRRKSEDLFEDVSIKGKKEFDRIMVNLAGNAKRVQAGRVAQYEATRNTNEALEVALDVGESEGLDVISLVRVWNTRADSLVRASHAAMHNQKKKKGEKFVSGKGNLLSYPGDPFAPADDTMNCRCILTVEKQV